MQDREFVQWALKFIKNNGMAEFQKLLANKIDIHAMFPMSCIWRVWDIVETEAQKQMSKLEKVQLFKQGRLDVSLAAEKYNKITNLYVAAMIQNNIGSPLPSQDLVVDYVGLGLTDSTADGVPPAATATQLGNEFYRSVPTEKYKANNTLVTMLYLESTEANPVNTTVASVASQLVFDVQAGQGANYTANDVIRVFTDQYETRVVDSVSTDTITLKTALNGSYAAGALVERGYGNCGMFCGDATASLDTGTPVNYAGLQFFKNILTSSLIEIHLNYVIAV